MFHHAPLVLTHHTCSHITHMHHNLRTDVMTASKAAGYFGRVVAVSGGKVIKMTGGKNAEALVQNAFDKLKTLNAGLAPDQRFIVKVFDYFSIDSGRQWRIFSCQFYLHPPTYLPTYLCICC